MAFANEPAVALDTDAQRAAIEEERRTETQGFDALAKNCERKFAVTRCLEHVQTLRLAVERKLNRQEAMLNDAQRQERAREQNERNREKAAAHVEKIAKLAKETPLNVRQPKPPPPKADPTRPSQPAGAKEPTLSAQERSANAREYNRRQAQAVAKRAEVAKRVKETGAKKMALPKPD